MFVNISIIFIDFLAFLNFQKKSKQIFALNSLMIIEKENKNYEN